MPSVGSSFGALTLPVHAGAASDPFADPPCLVLLDYLGFWLRAMLNDKLASMGGPTTADENYADACPTANRFPYDPLGGEIWRRNPKPALYCWWQGRSRTITKTLVYKVRERELGLMWVFCECQTPENDELRWGILAGVDAVINRAIDRQSHPAYGYNGATPGTPIWRSMGAAEIKLGDVTPGKLAPIPESSDRRDGALGHIVNYYPAVRATITVSERVPADSLDDPDDLNTDMSMVVSTNEEGDVLDTLDMVEIIIPGPPIGP